MRERDGIKPEVAGMKEDEGCESGKGAFFVYVLKSDSRGEFYVGSTGDLAGRLVKHNAGMSQWTAHGRPWRLVYRERFLTRGQAVRRERAIKARKSRKYIESLIVGVKGTGS